MQNTSSEDFKKSYIDCNNSHISSINKIKNELSITSKLLNNNKNIDKIKNKIDNLLDVFNYTNAAFNITKMQYLVLYIISYMKENNMLKTSKIPVKTSLKLLLKQDWITQDTKKFLSKFYERSLKGENFSLYVLNLDTYLQYIDILK